MIRREEIRGLVVVTNNPNIYLLQIYKSKMLQGTVLYCRTTYHRGPYVYYITRETPKYVFIKRMKAITIDQYADPSYSCATIIGVESFDEDAVYSKEFKLAKRIEEGKNPRPPLYDGLYFVGSADHGSPQHFYIWDGKPLIQESYY